MIAQVIVLGLMASAAAGRQSPAGTPAPPPSQEALCSLEEVPLGERARQLEPLGEAGRKALVALAESSARDELLCGIAGLAALGDRRAIAPLAAALRNPALRQDDYQLTRWAAFLAAGPAPDLGTAMLTVIEAASDQDTWDAAGNDAVWFMGEVDHPAARDRLLIELRLPLNAETLDAVIHGLARQGERRALETVTAMGVEALRAKSGNATPEQARRLGAVAFYQLALSPESLADGLATLGTIAARDQESAAAWAVHTLCARAVRRPPQRAAIEAQRKDLVDALASRGISWQAQKGPLGCTAATR